MSTVLRTAIRFRERQPFPENYHDIGGKFPRSGLQRSTKQASDSAVEPWSILRNPDIDALDVAWFNQRLRLTDYQPFPREERAPHSGGCLSQHAAGDRLRPFAHTP
jgi:hypothetical protein